MMTDNLRLHVATCFCSVINHKIMTQNAVRTKTWHIRWAECVTDVLTTFWCLPWSTCTVEPQLSGLIRTSVNSPDNRESE